MDAVVAQFSTPDVEAGLFKDILTVLGWVVAIGTGLWFKLRPQQLAQPVEIKTSVEYVRRSEFVEFKQQHQREQQELKRSIDQRFDDLREERRESLVNIHQHLDSLRVDLKQGFASIAERFEAGNERMNQHGEAIARIEGAITKKVH